MSVISHSCSVSIVLENFVFIIHETTALQTSNFKASNGCRNTRDSMHSLSTNHFVFEDFRNQKTHIYKQENLEEYIQSRFISHFLQ